MTLPAVQSYIDPTWDAVNPGGMISVADDFIGGVAQDGSILSLFELTSGVNTSSTNFSVLDISPGTGGAMIYGNGSLWLDKDDDDNYVGLAQVDPSGPTLLDTWGTGSGFSNYPDNVQLYDSAAVLTIGDTHWLVTGSGGGGSIDVSRLDPPGSFGFWGHHFLSAGSFNSVCAGPQNSSQAIAYELTYPDSGDSPFALYATTILAAAAAYDPTTWPTANIDIGTSLIVTFEPAMFDATWTHIVQMNGPAYDSTDGNVLIMVGTNDSVAQQNYLAKVSTTTGAIMWLCPIARLDAAGSQGVVYSRISYGTFLYYDGSVHVVDTRTGDDSTISIAAVEACGAQTSDDSLGALIGFMSIDAGGGGIVLLNSTPAEFESLGILYVIPPGSAASVVMADSQFLGI